MAKKSKTSSKTGSSVHDFDLAIIGGGPVGLACAAALKDKGLRLAIIEKLPETALASPAFDGRDTAMTHSAIKILGDLGIYQRIKPSEFSPIRQACVINGTSPYALNFDSKDDNKDALGYLISSHTIRQTAYENVKAQPNLEILTGHEVTAIGQGEAKNTLTLSHGKKLSASLVVAADSRFSNARRMMGIASAMRDFGRTVVVARMKHDKPHNQIAYECFHYGRTLAVLPLQGNTCSVVITLPSDQVAALLAMSAQDFAAEVAERFEHRLGAMKLVTDRHAYPLMAVYADRFNDHRFALLGDAAVGMHPVTAHGYNFGLYGVRNLAAKIDEALGLGLDIASPSLLNRFNAEHRRATLPIYLGTNAVVSLFTDERPMAKHARSAVLRLGNLAMPLKQIITRQLTQSSLPG